MAEHTKIALERGFALIERNNELLAARQRIAELEAAIRSVVETFEKDEAQGFHSRDREFAIRILKPVVGR